MSKHLPLSLFWQNPERRTETGMSCGTVSLPVPAFLKVLTLIYIWVNAALFFLFRLWVYSLQCQSIKAKQNHISNMDTILFKSVKYENCDKLISNNHFIYCIHIYTYTVYIYKMFDMSPTITILASRIRSEETHMISVALQRDLGAVTENSSIFFHLKALEDVVTHLHLSGTDWPAQQRYRWMHAKLQG